ncbi:MAG: OmpA family protein [Deltaproteobacteria bacterium]|nr:OmpA family protein [Deltaproteobacteria bacterium]MBW2123196.1 OmpA family protein [Deltaproteobacteria bacterium]
MKGRKREEEESGLDPNAWMVTFSDLLTLLLTFFVLLLTMSSMDNKRLREAFGFFGGTEGGLETEGKGSTTEVATPYDVRYPGMYVLPPGTLRSEAFPEIRLSWGKGEGRAKPVARMPILRVERELRKGMESLGLNRGVEISREAGGLVVRFSEGVLFDIGEAEIDFQGTLVLGKCGEILGKIPNRIRIAGHTDDIPVLGGRYKTNWELSTARAVNVLRFFTESMGLDPKRFSAVGYGKYRPLVPNTSPENRAMNRRAEIAILSSRPGQPL